MTTAERCTARRRARVDDAPEGAIVADSEGSQAQGSELRAVRQQPTARRDVAAAPSLAPETALVRGGESTERDRARERGRRDADGGRGTDGSESLRSRAATGAIRSYTKAAAGAGPPIGAEGDPGGAQFGL